MKDIQRSQLRLPADLHELLKISSAAAGRSLNAEIVFRLAQSFENPHVPTRRTELSAIADQLADPSNRPDLEALLTILARLGIFR